MKGGVAGRIGIGAAALIGVCVFSLVARGRRGVGAGTAGRIVGGRVVPKETPGENPLEKILGPVKPKMAFYSVWHKVPCDQCGDEVPILHQRRVLRGPWKDKVLCGGCLLCIVCDIIEKRTSNG